MVVAQVSLLLLLPGVFRFSWLLVIYASVGSKIDRARTLIHSLSAAYTPTNYGRVPRERCDFRGNVASVDFRSTRALYLYYTEL